MKVLTYFLLIVTLNYTSAIKIFYIGGATNSNQTLVWNQLAKTIPNRPPQPNNCDQNWSNTKCPKIAVVTSAASNSSAGNEAYSVDQPDSLSYRTMFLKFGMAPKHITIHLDNYKTAGDTNTAEGKANLLILQQADIIFFNGGDQSRHVRCWLNDDGTQSVLLSVIKARAFGNNIVLVGTSAGSMVWSPQTYGGGDSFGTLYFRNSIGLASKKITDPQGLADTRAGNSSLQYDHNGAKMQAFGFVDFVVDTHFEARGRLGRLPAALVDLKVSLGIGVDQKTAFYYNNGVGTVYGYNGATICDMSESIVEPKPYFTARGIIGSYLTHGDSYDFKTKTVFSTKTLIKSPAYNNPTDSSDILAAFEASLLASRVVDQKATYNLGSTKTPSSFPRNTPKFEIKFYRDAQSKGYYSNKKYTVTHIRYDYSYGANLVNLRYEEEQSRN